MVKWVKELNKMKGESRHWLGYATGSGKRDSSFAYDIGKLSGISLS
jgi:hypothetical protein